MLDQEMRLTNRQQLLFNRLVTLGEWASSGAFPMTVLEIRGFGSFFRGKQRPHDVDLLVRVQRPEQLPAFSEFLEILKDIRYDWDLEDRFETPHAAMTGLRSEDDERLSGVCDENQQHFLSWIEPYSWNMLRPTTIRDELAFGGPESYARRMVKKRLPNLNVFAFLNPTDTDLRPLGLRCGFTVSIWSQDRQDTTVNLNCLLSHNRVRQNLQHEMAYFSAQLPKVQAEVDLVRAELDLLLSIPRRRKSFDFGWQWFETWSKNRPELQAPRQAVAMATEIAKQFDDEGSSIVCEQIPTADVVDECRKEIKSLYQRLDRLTSVRNELAHFKCGAARTELKAAEYVVDELLDQGSKREQEEMAEFLRGMQFPVDRMLRRTKKEMRQGRR